MKKIQLLMMLAICLFAATFARAQSFLGTATFSSVPATSTLFPVQILMDDNAAGGGIGIGNVVGAGSTSGYFVIVRGEGDGTISWSMDYNIFARGGALAKKAVRIQDYYYVLYTRYRGTAAIGNYVAKIDAANGTVVANTLLQFNFTTYEAIDITTNEKYLYILGQNREDADHCYMVTSIMDQFTLAVVTSRMDGFEKDNQPEGIAVRELDVYVGCRIKNNGNYDQLGVISYFHDATNQVLTLQQSKRYYSTQWNEISRLYTMRLKYNRFNDKVVMSAQAFIKETSTPYHLELFNLDPISISLTDASHYSYPGRMFTSDLNIDDQYISLAGPNMAGGSLSNGNAVAIFDHTTAFDKMVTFPFGGTGFERHALGGPVKGTPFVMAAQVANYVNYTVGTTYSRRSCRVGQTRLENIDYKVYEQDGSWNQEIKWGNTDVGLSATEDKLDYSIDCRSSIFGGVEAEERTAPGGVETPKPYTIATRSSDIIVTAAETMDQAILYDMTGRAVQTFAAGTTIQISKENLAPGNYMLVFTTGKKLFREKLGIY